MRHPRRRVLKFHSTIVGVLTVGSVLLAPRCLAQPKPGRRGCLRTFLRDYLEHAHAGKDMTTRYFSALVDLKNDGTQEFIVYVTGQKWCGSGGCRMLVLAPKGASFKVVGETTVTHLPIRELATKSNGWHDIGVWVQGGGIQPGYEAELPFAGDKYPSNPSIPPARRLEGNVVGEVVVPTTAVGKPLY